MDSSYKARKEAFVSDLSGSNISDINAVSLVAPVSFRQGILHEHDELTIYLSRHLSSSGPPFNHVYPFSHRTVLPHC